jgi:hypothetical protein
VAPSSAYLWIKEFECEICNQSFRDKSNRKTHLRLLHASKVVQTIFLLKVIVGDTRVTAAALLLIYDGRLCIKTIGNWTIRANFAKNIWWKQVIEWSNQLYPYVSVEMSKVFRFLFTLLRSDVQLIFRALTDVGQKPHNRGQDLGRSAHVAKSSVGRSPTVQLDAQTGVSLWKSKRPWNEPAKAAKIWLDGVLTVFCAVYLIAKVARRSLGRVLY